MFLAGTLNQQASYYFKLLTMVLLCLSHWLKKSDLISSNMKEFHDESDDEDRVFSSQPMRSGTDFIIAGILFPNFLTGQTRKWQNSPYKSKC
ncbi:hypothetical protein SAMN05518863_10748 [Candidatus Pantoea symbiotica]|jgi:hypothetical protein|uniref:Uncharacterized protein n=1 Tax=Candidatus Pantoea symbiotica TaxID=1884370 RepID=A0A1I3ZIS8_9GAMM|nr:hypothetical protein SAMN05518863_10748 [Pantoea symbiotica]SFU93447.1 hypothetical protein SAMN05518864_107277 [Pantoea sp. YR525]